MIFYKVTRNTAPLNYGMPLVLPVPYKTPFDEPYKTPFDELCNIIVKKKVASDFKEDGSFFVATLNLAGVDPDSITVDLQETEEDTTFVVSYGDGQTKTLYLGKRPYDSSKGVTCKVLHGLLTIHVPRRNSSRSIKVER